MLNPLMLATWLFSGSRILILLIHGRCHWRSFAKHGHASSIAPLIAAHGNWSPGAVVAHVPYFYAIKYIIVCTMMGARPIMKCCIDAGASRDIIGATKHRRATVYDGALIAIRGRHGLQRAQRIFHLPFMSSTVSKEIMKQINFMRAG